MIVLRVLPCGLGNQLFQYAAGFALARKWGVTLKLDLAPFYSYVPKAESDLLVAVLRELKKPHEYVVYDDEGHGFTRRRNVLDSARRTTDFFIKHLGKR